MHVINQICVLLLWMHTLTFAQISDCTLEQFINGPLFNQNFDTTGLQPSYPAGKQIRVGCSIGYSGFFRLTCVEGRWESKGTVCQPKSCGHPGDAQFADFNLEIGDDFVFGSKVAYTCHKGYQMVSRTNHRNCMNEGWDGVVPVCEAQQCPVIHVDNNVQVNGVLEEATYGNVVRFSCKSNSEILSNPRSAELYCDENGEWSGQPPKCIEIKCTAPQIENGYVTDRNIQEYKEHDVLLFECNDRYKRTEERAAKCTKVGMRAEWTPTPACEPIICKVNLPPVEGTMYESVSKNVFLPGETLTVICGEKYWISNKMESAVTTCNEKGEWTIRPICTEVVCTSQRPQNVYSWDVKWWEHPKMGETTRYRCMAGYVTAVTQATCTRDGWTPNPLCRETTCDRWDRTDADVISEYKQTYRYNEQVRYDCKDGYKGEFTLTCREDGWYGHPSCTEITCKKQTLPDADIVDNNKRTYRYNEPVGYRCKDGNRERFTLTCGEDGWIGSSPCTATCPKADVPNGFAVGPYNNTTIYYTCNKGFKLFTNKGWWAEAKCNDRLQQCIENAKCGETPVIPNGELVPIQRQRQTPIQAKVVCNTGYSPQIKRYDCNNGKWIPNGKSTKDICKPTGNLCKPPPKVENAVVQTSYQKEYLSNSTVTYLCRDGYDMEGENTIQCINGTWEEKIITCTLRED